MHNVYWKLDETLLNNPRTKINQIGEFAIIIKVLSLLPEATSFPSGLKATELT